MFVKELYVMAVINNMQITSHFIYNVETHLDIYKYFQKKYNLKVIIHHNRGRHLTYEILDQIINWKYNSLFLYVYI